MQAHSTRLMSHDSHSPLPPGPADMLRQPASSPPCPTEALRALWRYGDVTRYRTPMQEVTLLSHPDAVRTVLSSDNFVRVPFAKNVLGPGVVPSDGPLWERRRKLMLPEFARDRVGGMVATFRDTTSARADTWTAAPDGVLDISREMDHLALLNIGRVLFGFDPDEAFLDAFAVVLAYMGKLSNAATLGFPLQLRANDNQDFEAALASLEATVREVMDSQPEAGAALLHLLRDGEQPLASTELRNEIIAMLTAGHETTAVTLTWMWDALVRDPAMTERFYAEVDAVAGDRPVTVEDLPRLEFTNQLLLETMRLCPPIWIVGRLAQRDAVVGGYQIHGGSILAVSPFLTHRHPDFWDDPEEFRPERWSTPTVDHPFAYFPFLAGRHLCLGKHLAITEILTVMATIAQRCRFEPVREQPSAYNASFSLRIQDGLPVRVRRRA